MEQIGQMLSSFNTFNGGGFGRIGGEQGATIDYDTLARAIASRIGELLDGAQFVSRGIKLNAEEAKPGSSVPGGYTMDGAFGIDVDIDPPTRQGPAPRF